MHYVLFGLVIGYMTHALRFVTVCACVYPETVTFANNEKLKLLIVFPFEMRCIWYVLSTVPMCGDRTSEIVYIVIYRYCYCTMYLDLHYRNI